MKSKEVIKGIVILLLLIVIVVVVKWIMGLSTDGLTNTEKVDLHIAVGGGKEGFLADEDVLKILKKKYGITVTYDTWSNGQMIKKALLRDDGSHYDAMFPSDQRFYDYYKLTPDKSKGEAARDKVIKGGLTLNTPIVIYSWKPVVEALEKENIVTLKNGTYYITDMNKLMTYILEGKKWSEIGVDELYGTINIDSTDPVTSSPGATYYGLLLSILCGGTVTEESMEENLPKLKEFYIKSGYMNNTPADLFEMYLKTGMGGKPMIVDYEKSLIEFAISNPDGWNQVKDEVVVLYPEPTIWNSHCIATFNEAGNKYYDAIEDVEIGQIAWSRYGFRTGVTGSSYDVSSVGIDGVPQNITSTVSSLKMNMYDRLIEYLGQ